MPGLEQTLKDTAELISSRGWGEANAGNLSLNLTEALTPHFGAGTWFLVSQTGSRWRHVARNPLPHLVLIKLADESEEYFPAQAKPTSEWSCHKLLQKHFLATGSEDRVVLHSHPNSVILLSQMDLAKDEAKLNSCLREALAELELFLPDGVAITGAALPGSQKLALGSLDVIGKRKALIWQGHGLVCTAKHLDEALDYMEVVEKAANIALGKFFLTKMPLLD